MIGIQRLRELAGDKYSHKSDEEFARAYHRKLYPNMDYEEFLRRFQAASADYGKKGRGRGGSKSSGESRQKKQEGPSRFDQEASKAGYGRDKTDGLYYRWAIDEEGNRKLNYNERMSDNVLAEIQRKIEAGEGDGDPLGLRQKSETSNDTRAWDASLMPGLGREPVGAGARSPVMDVGRELDRRALARLEAEYPDGLPDEYYAGPNLGINGASPYYQGMRQMMPQSYADSENLYPDGGISPFRWGGVEGARPQLVAQAAPAQQTRQYQSVDIGPDSLGSGANWLSGVFTGIGNGIAGVFRNRGEAEEEASDYTRDFRR